MRKIYMTVFIFCLLVFLYGCTKKEKPAITIGSIEITPQEFESAFQKSVYAGIPTNESHKEFLDSLIDRKLILKEAEKHGLDKEPEFLDSVQFFWEQSLLRIMLNQKIKELSAPIKISEQEINDYYDTHKGEFSGKDISEVREQIRLQLFKQKQKKAISEWVNSLRKNAKIKVNYKALGLE